MTLTAALEGWPIHLRHRPSTTIDTAIFAAYALEGFMRRFLSAREYRNTPFYDLALMVNPASLASFGLALDALAEGGGDGVDGRVLRRSREVVDLALGATPASHSLLHVDMSFASPMDRFRNAPAQDSSRLLPSRALERQRSPAAQQRPCPRPQPPKPTVPGTTRRVGAPDAAGEALVPAGPQGGPLAGLAGLKRNPGPPAASGAVRGVLGAASVCADYESLVRRNAFIKKACSDELWTLVELFDADLGAPAGGDGARRQPGSSVADGRDESEEAAWSALLLRFMRFSAARLASADDRDVEAIAETFDVLAARLAARRRVVWATREEAVQAIKDQETRDEHEAQARRARQRDQGNAVLRVVNSGPHVCRVPNLWTARHFEPTFGGGGVHRAAWRSRAGHCRSGPMGEWRCPRRIRRLPAQV